MKPQVVRVASGLKKSRSQDAPSDDEATPHQILLLRDSTAVTIIDDTPNLEQGPFGDPPKHHQSNSSLSAVIEEAEKKAASSQGTQGTSKDKTPFGDEHEVNE